MESNRATWLILFAVLLGHGMLAAVPTVGPGRAGWVRTFLLDVLTPIERGVDAAVHGVGGVWSGYVALLDARRENEVLRDRLAELEIQMARDRSAVLEARRLREFYDLPDPIAGGRVAARVIGRDATTSRETLTIDKGTMHGLEVNASVVTPAGLVGRVIHAAHWSSTVQLISDPDSAVAVVVDESRVPGIVAGRSDRALRLEHVDATGEFRVGDRLVTSGTDGVYPRGLPVGAVSELGPIENMMQTARVRPAADLGRLEEVLGLVDAAATGVVADPSPD